MLILSDQFSLLLIVGLFGLPLNFYDCLHQCWFQVAYAYNWVTSLLSHTISKSQDFLVQLEPIIDWLRFLFIHDFERAVKKTIQLRFGPPKSFICFLACVYNLILLHKSGLTFLSILPSCMVGYWSLSFKRWNSLPDLILEFLCRHRQKERLLRLASQWNASLVMKILVGWFQPFVLRLSLESLCWLLELNSYFARNFIIWPINSRQLIRR